MSRYKTLLFDIDDTLLDFAIEEEVALRLLYADQPIPYTPELRATYQAINARKWAEFERGEIDRTTLLHGRHTELFETYGLEVDGEAFEGRYRHHLSQGFALIDGAFELMASLQDRFELYLVTNGIASIQYSRLENAGLRPFFKGVFVSEETGFRKPQLEFFEYVFARIPGFERSSTLIVGDSLSADIVGGHRAGIDTCWFNRDEKPNPSGVVPTYSVHRLDELDQVLA